MSGSADPRSIPPAAPGSVLERLPRLATLRRYERAWLVPDVVGGIVLTAILVPVGMGYAEAAGLQPINGLYATMAPLVATRSLGPSRILVLGPDSSLAPLIAATIVPLAAGDSANAVALRPVWPSVGGLSLCRGDRSRGFRHRPAVKAHPLRLPQRHRADGLRRPAAEAVWFLDRRRGPPDETVAFVQGVADGLTNPVALAIGVAALPSSSRPGLSSETSRRPPGGRRRDHRRGRRGLASVAVSTVGPLPQGLPVVRFRRFPTPTSWPLVAGAAPSPSSRWPTRSVLSRTFAARRGERPERTGAHRPRCGELSAAVLQGFPISASASRTLGRGVGRRRTQLTGRHRRPARRPAARLRAGLPPTCPPSLLAAIVIAACLSLVEVRGVVRLFRHPSVRVRLSMICFLGVAAIGVVAGIFFSVGVALAPSCGAPGGRTAPCSGASRASRATTTSTATRRRAACPASSSSAGTRRSSSPTPRCSASASRMPSSARRRRSAGSSSRPSR